MEQSTPATRAAVADIAGTTIAFETVGEGPALLICHGGPGLHHGAYRTLDPLATGRELVYWDHRGHGRSGRPPRATLSMAQWADDAAALAARLGIVHADVLGHSFGGWVAQELALRHPRLVRSLVLVATTPGQLGTSESPDDDQGPPPPAEIVELLGRRPVDDVQVAATYAELAPWFTRTASPDLLRDHLDPALVDAASMVAVFEELARWSSVDRLSSISCPTLVVGGRHDVFCSPQQAERIARFVPHAELAVFDEAGHFVWLEDPDGFFGLVDGWLRGG